MTFIRFPARILALTNNPCSGDEETEGRGSSVRWCGHNDEDAEQEIKDLAMAETADCGLVLWDGESIGTINNILELLQRGKIAVVYFSPEQQFATLKSGDDLTRLLQHVDRDNLAEIKKKTGLEHKLRQLEQRRVSQLELI